VSIFKFLSCSCTRMVYFPLLLSVAFEQCFCPLFYGFPPPTRDSLLSSTNGRPFFTLTAVPALSPTLFPRREEPPHHPFCRPPIDQSAHFVFSPPFFPSFCHVPSMSARPPLVSHLMDDSVRVFPPPILASRRYSQPIFRFLHSQPFVHYSFFQLHLSVVCFVLLFLPRP